MHEPASREDSHGALHCACTFRPDKRGDLCPSVAAGVVLIQGYRDTAPIHAKLDETIVALEETRNDVVGLEHADPAEIREKLIKFELEAAQTSP
jgi:hypothetical protein